MVEALANLLPHSWNRYIEPMAGGAAFFFHTQPASAVLADVNSDLVAFYSALRESPRELIRRLRLLKASREQYYAFRASRPRGHIQRAVRFAYLNRLAWNGLYRVNRSGEFNVPIGDRLPAVMWNEADLLKASELLNSASLVVADFRVTARQAKPGDFVFFDPPYPRGSRERIGFNRYASSFFTLADHRDLASTIVEMTKHSIQVMLTLTNASHIDKIYPSSMRRARIRSKALIACNGSDRRHVTELILTNY
jgi:DNA adenine methylase